MKYYSLLLASFLLIFCSDNKSSKENKKVAKEIFKTSKEFNDYWYDGTAEITSYKLTQARYGELHEGTAVTIFVTEDFLPEKQVKADYKNEKNIPILKLNKTKKFFTGIYPYSIMTSTFSPINIDKKSLKISFSSQEWCGNTFVQLNNKEKFEVDFHSYFENNSDEKISLEKDYLEDELWNIIRISQEKLPVGEFMIIPSFEYLSLNHQTMKSYKAITSFTENGNFVIYNIDYPSLRRTLNIVISKNFPHNIESWEETINSRGKKLSTKAEKMKTLKLKYWNKNSPEDKKLREFLNI
ncbi:MAG: septum formation inhibitor Maf [Polaribacter sp.]|uniref:septum formation inhibitor Maf n=1 Tax=Polaribacter sp. TaxID=1920175 RepID=UPI003BB0E2D5